jgi:hypothetical protein
MVYYPVTLNLIYIDEYGADPTGISFSDTAMAAAQAAAGSGPYLIVGGAGTYKFAGSYSFGRQQGFLCPGSAVTTLVYTGDSILLNAWYDSFSASTSIGGKFGGFTIDGTSAGSAAAGMRWGDLLRARCSDIRIQNFTGASAKGLYMHNVNGWSEQGEWTGISLANCTSHAYFDTGSFDYSYYRFVIEAQAGQDGIRMENNASIEGGFFELLGNFQAAAGNTGAVFALDRLNPSTGSARIDSVLMNVGVEPDGTTGLGHYTVLMLGGSSEQFNGNGVLRFLTPGGGNQPFQAGTFGGSFGIMGIVEEPSLGQLNNGDAGVFQGGSQWAAFGNLATETLYTGMYFYPQAGDYQSWAVPDYSITIEGVSGEPFDRARRMVLSFQQPSGGSGVTPTWPSNWKWAGGNHTLSSGASDIDTVTLTYVPSSEIWLAVLNTAYS